MPFPIEDKLVIAMSSSALFDLSESDRVFREQGPAAYKKFQQDNLDTVLDTGLSFPFIRRFLAFNQYFSEEKPVKVESCAFFTWHANQITRLSSAPEFRYLRYQVFENRATLCAKKGMDCSTWRM